MKINIQNYREDMYLRAALFMYDLR